jgi:hypothetical protein
MGKSPERRHIDLGEKLRVEYFGRRTRRDHPPF